MHQLQALTACADGLTPAEEDMFDLDPDATASTARSLEEHLVARYRDGNGELRSPSSPSYQMLMHNDQVLSAFTKAITASPSLQTLISLPPSPLLYLIGSASQKSYSALWPSIASALIFRLAPSSFFRRKVKSGSQEDLTDQAEEAETLRVVVLTTDTLIRSTANVLQDSASLQSVSQLKGGLQVGNAECLD
jgi:hypothetical protein